MKTKLTILMLLSLLLSFGCSKSKKASIPEDHNTKALVDNEDFFNYPEEVKFYVDSPNAENIKRCAFAHDDKKSCKFSESPLIGITDKDITIESILRRTMATKQSYVETFRQVLKRMPKETLVMFGAINSIAISERIRPSFYTYVTGGIYLSTSYFWKNPEEKSAALAKKDFRQDFGKTLAYDFSDDYLNGQDSLYDLSRGSTRTDYELSFALSKVLFHELTHANDHFQKALYNSPDLDLNKTYYEFANESWDKKNSISQNVPNTPKSIILSRAGDIVFNGETPTDSELNTITAPIILDEYKNDTATNMYGYASAFEDTAMLVENALMLHYFKYNSYTVFIEYPHANFKIPEDYEYKLAGGLKNKIADGKVKSRAQFVMNKILSIQETNNVMMTLDSTQMVEIPETATFSTLSDF